ncbi:MAG: 16S rRNA (cytosine(1402)-N(4))-methyltransferase RsmH [Leptospiraceae bacterium]|nr:16S rRNA (cytosine(1402)-N(4))-methyltransferase RsmH [Leptospiraceae bacterium]MDW7976253.1 16S rRNA (cytosine(1402)-N(4))-methyltransferase RsmH [Leptospiraceae bacterium]
MKTLPTLEEVKSDFFHFPVLYREVCDFASLLSNRTLFVDATIGGGAHSYIIHQHYPFEYHVGFDRDERMINKAKENFDRLLIPNEILTVPSNKISKNKIYLVNQRFSNIREILKHFGKKINFLLCDLGISMYHLKNSWGFSFDDGLLDMRLDPESMDVKEILNTFEENALSKIFLQYGEEKFSKIIAKEIIRNRPIESSSQLKEIIIKVYYKKYRTRIQPKVVQRVFQALRIYANQELQELEELLKILPDVLDHRAIAIFISFHSLEDRLIKTYFKNYQAKGHVILTKKPLTPKNDEVKINPASRSAKLRALQWKNTNS